MLLPKRKGNTLMTKSYKSSACKCLRGLWNSAFDRHPLAASGHLCRGGKSWKIFAIKRVITGASNGFGKGAALHFAEGGANVVLAAKRKRLPKDVAAECRQR